MLEFHSISVNLESSHCAILGLSEFVDIVLEYTFDYSENDETTDKKLMTSQVP